MIVYRLSRTKYSHDLSGKGAEISGGRWNSKGVALLYTGQNIALCMAEVAVHIPLGIIPVDYELITLEIPDDKITELKKHQLPDDWNAWPLPYTTQNLGDDFVKRGKSLVLKVLSAVVQGEFNYLINPIHPNIKKVKIKKTESFSFDHRLFVR